jgi:predicted permease
VFRHAPAFTTTALLVLALGIGSTVAVFTIVNAVLLKPAGGRADGVLVGVYLRERERPDRYRAFSPEQYAAIRGAAQGFSGILAQQLTPVLVDEGDRVRRSFAGIVSANYFSTLAVAPALGRAFLDSEERVPSAVVIVSHAYWKRTGAADAILGRTVRINGADLQVIGVAPAGFSGTMALLSPEFWIPLGAATGLGLAGAHAGAGRPPSPTLNLSLVGRLRPGVSGDTARGLATPLTNRLATQRADVHADLEIVVGDVARLSTGESPPDTGEVQGVLFFLLAMSGIVLVIAALNLANMLLARGAARQREMAIRMALGARGGRIVRQLMTESLALSLGGAALGAGLAWGGTHVLAATLQPILPMPIAVDPHPDWRVLSAAGVSAVVCSVVFGLAPALGVARADIQTRLRPAGVWPVGRRRLTTRNLLVVSQLALSLVLLSAAGLFLKGAWKATDADPGYPLDRGVVAIIDCPEGGMPGPGSCDRWRDALHRVRRLPGVESASLASSIAFGVHVQGRPVRRAGAPAADAAYALFTVTGAQYFKTLDIPLLYGREFTSAEEETGGAGRPVIVNEPLARALWPNGNAIGQLVQFGDGDDSAADVPREVIGVVRGVRQSLFDTAPVPQAFVPLPGAPFAGEGYLHVRVQHGSTEAQVIERVRRELRAGVPTLPLLSVVTLNQHRDRSIYMWVARASAHVFTWFGVAALALATLGVYGVKAFLVTQRTREIGIRIALGATRGGILRLVVADGAAWTVTALGVGLAVSLALARVLASWVYGVGLLDVASVAVTLGVLLAASLLACYLPARRAAALSPTVALRQE